MGIEINTNVGSPVTLGSQSVAGSEQSKVFEHLAYTFNVNKASENSVNVSLSDNLKAQLTSIGRAIGNSQSVANIMNLTQATLSQVEDIITAIKNARGLFGDSHKASENLVAALNNIADAKGNMTSFVANVIEPAINRNSVAMENLRASNSSISDFGIAQGSARAIGQQLLSNSNSPVSAQASQTTESVLQLLAK